MYLFICIYLFAVKNGLFANCVEFFRVRLSLCNINTRWEKECKLLTKINKLFFSYDKFYSFYQVYLIMVELKDIQLYQKEHPELMRNKQINKSKSHSFCKIVFLYLYLM